MADMQVLDLGCGDGTTALPAAQRGADVLGVDIASNLVRDYYGPTVNAFAAAEASDRAAELQSELETLFAAQNRSADPARTLAHATYLNVTITRP